MSQPSRFWKKEDGAALVEAMVVLPFFMVLALGILEFGNLLYQYHHIVSGVRDAARYLARVQDPTSAESTAKQIAVTGETSGGDKRVSWWNTSDITVSYTNIANPIDPGTGERPYRDDSTVTIIRVTANVSYPGIGFLDLLGLGSPLDISISHEQRHIGF
jgi:hypothetical protein